MADEITPAPAVEAAIPDPYGATATEPATHEGGHDGAAAILAQEKINQDALTALARAVAAVGEEMVNLLPVPGHQATGMARASLALALDILKRERAHVERVIVP